LVVNNVEVSVSDEDALVILDVAPVGEQVSAVVLDHTVKSDPD
jgi:hypothetical protein